MSMNILVTVDERYVTYLMVMLESLFVHNGQEMDIYLLYSDISEESLDRLRRFVSGHGKRLHTVRVDEKLFGTAPVFRYFSRTMYYRLLCADLLPERAGRALYLDPDILVRGSVLELYEQDLHGCSIAGVPDRFINRFQPEHRDALGLEDEEPYVNSGVLLFDLEKMRREFDRKELLRCLEEHREKTLFPDQDAINLYFRSDIHVLPRKYNYNTGYGTLRDMLRYMAGWRDPAKPQPVIVHYMGESKPWQDSYYGKYFWEYYAYYRKYLSGRERLNLLVKPLWVAKKMIRAARRRMS